jgi:hypothetical protein
MRPSAMDHHSPAAPPEGGATDLAVDINAPVASPLLRAAPWIALVVALAILAGHLATDVQIFADGGFFAFAFLTGDPWGRISPISRPAPPPSSSPWCRPSSGRGWATPPARSASTG